MNKSYPASRALSAARRQAQRDAQVAAEAAQPVAAHIEALNGTLGLASDAALVGFLKSGIDARMLLAWQLANRGLNQEGAWVGFAEAERLFVAAFPGAIDAGLLV